MATPPTGLTTFVANTTRITAAWANAVDGLLRGAAINVRSSVYGAAADGMTNDDAEISAAGAAASAAGIGAVYLPAGNYKIGSPTWYSGVFYIGDGVGKTILTGTASTNPMVGFSSCTGSGLIGMTLAGPTSGTTCQPLYVHNSTFCLFRDLRITGGVIGAIQCTTDVADCVFENIDIYDTRLASGVGVAFWLFDGATRNRIRGLRIRTCQGSALGLDASSDIGDTTCSENSFTDVYIEDSNTVSGVASIYLHSGKRNTFNGVRIKGGSAAGISIQTDQIADVIGGSDDNLFTDVAMENVGTVAVYIDGGSRNVVQVGKVYNSTRAAGGHPVRFDSHQINSTDMPCRDNIVTIDSVVTTNTYDHPVSHQADSAAGSVIQRNVFRTSRPFLATFNASSVVNAAQISLNTTDLGVMTGSATWNPGSLADGAGESTTVTVTGALLGDVVDGVSFSLDLQGMTLTGYVSAADTVTVRLQNESGGTLDLASGTLRVSVRRILIN